MYTFCCSRFPFSNILIRAERPAVPPIKQFLFETGQLSSRQISLRRRAVENLQKNGGQQKTGVE